MGKKRVRQGSKAPSQPKKSSKATSSSAVAASTKGAKDAYPLIWLASTRGLHFASEDLKSRYEVLATRKTSEQKYFHADSLRTLGVLADMLYLIAKLG